MERMREGTRQAPGEGIQWEGFLGVAVSGRGRGGGQRWGLCFWTFLRVSSRLSSPPLSHPSLPGSTLHPLPEDLWFPKAPSDPCHGQPKPSLRRNQSNGNHGKLIFTEEHATATPHQECLQMSVLILEFFSSFLDLQVPGHLSRRSRLSQSARTCRDVHLPIGLPAVPMALTLGPPAEMAEQPLWAAGFQRKMTDHLSEELMFLPYTASILCLSCLARQESGFEPRSIMYHCDIGSCSRSPPEGVADVCNRCMSSVPDFFIMKPVIGRAFGQTVQWPR